MGRRVNKLYDMEFDEVSSVDRPANQHGLIAIAKSHDAAGATEEGGMSQLFDESGSPVDEYDLQDGDSVFDEAGNAYVYVEDDDDDYDDDDLEKSLWADGVKGAKGIAGSFRLGRSGVAMGNSAMAPVKTGNAVERAANWAGRNPRKAALIGGGTAAGVAGGGAYMLGRKGEDVTASKSLGDEVLEQLSKAVSESDRELIIAKALDEVEVAKAEAYAAQEELAWLQDERITDAFIAKAAEYNLPVAPEVFGPILKAAATVLDDEELDILDHVLSAAGELIYDEIGYAGGGSNSVFDQVSGLATEMVTKSAGDFSLEQASTAMFSANPDAYDAYIAEQNGR